MKLILEEGRPLDMEGRLEKERKTYELLDKLEIPYKRIDHEAVYTIDACGEIDKILKTEICKNLFLCNGKKTEYYLLLLPGHKKFVTREVCRQLGSTRLSFAKEEDMEKYLGLTPGSVTVMGLMNDQEGKVRLAIDREVAEQPVFACHPCINTSSILLSTQDMIQKFLPAVNHSPVFLDL